MTTDCKTESPIERLSKLNQFVFADIEGQKKYSEYNCVLLNVITGAFVTTCYRNVSNGFFKTPSRIVLEAVNITWMEGSVDNMAHSFKLSGEALVKFEAAMRAQSESLSS